jgi:hypothetical protein
MLKKAILNKQNLNFKNVNSLFLNLLDETVIKISMKFKTKKIREDDIIVKSLKEKIKSKYFFVIQFNRDRISYDSMKWMIFF